MAATVYKSSAAADLEYGIVNETDIILTSFSRNVQSVKTEVRDAENDVVATLALANETDAYGLSGGTIIVDSVNESIAQGDFKKISVSATQYASTMTA
jgi:hypothetical protein